MKKLIALLLILVLVPVASMADLPDISGLSFDELIQLREQLNLAIWNSAEWKEVTVPIGVWKVGEDIPQGKWTIRGENGYTYIQYCSELDSNGREGSVSGRVYYSEIIDIDSDLSPDSIDLDMYKGLYFIVKSGKAVFTPFTGKHDLGFN